jgi:ubiquinone/menaquinone biosynthesis C-methylase UbiE
VVTDCERLPFVKEEFNVVSAVALSDYLPDLAKALDEMRRVARPGAHVLITVPDRRCINFRIWDFLHSIWFRTPWITLRFTGRSEIRRVPER